MLAAAVVVAAALALTASRAAVPERVTPTANRLALVLPESHASGVAARGLSTAVDSGEILYDLEIHVASVDAHAPQADVDRLVARIRTGGVGLVVALGGGPAARALAKIVRGLPETRFVFVDASLSELSLEGVPNAAAIRFAEEDVLFLGGYLSGLMPTMDGSAQRVDKVSVAAGEPTRETARLVAGIRRGLRETSPGVKVRVDYVHELEDPTACERLSNTQIDEGSDVVFALAGRCGLGAIEVARIRGVWGVGAYEDGIGQRQRPHILMSTHMDDRHPVRHR